MMRTKFSCYIVLKKDQDMHAGKWNGLGGKVEPGETPDECAIREVQEESGLIVDTPILRGVITFPQFDGQNDWYVFVYRFDNFSGDLIDSPEGNLAWLSYAELEKLPLWEGDRIFMQWLKEEAFFSAKFEYQSGKLLRWDVIWY